jgi:hypothetical protein
MSISPSSNETIVGILLGQIKTENVTKLCETVSKYPYCTSFSHSSDTVLGLYVIPKNHCWWLEWVEQEPQETLGLDKAEVFFIQAILTSSPWSRGEVQAKLEKAPYGANCLECAMYTKKCLGCPGTQYFLDK